MYHPADPLIQIVRKQRRLKALAILALAVTVVVIVLGSRAKPESGADAVILGPPVQSAAMPLDKLFPAGKDSEWMSYVHDGPTVTPVTTRGGGYERQTGRMTATLLSVVRNEVVQRSVFELKGDSVSRIAIGPGAETRIDPPLPLFSTGAKFGAINEWRGRFIAGSKAIPAMAVYRVSGLERLKTVAGVFKAHRIDSILLSQTAKDKLNRLQTVAWFAPGVGVVKEMYVQDGRVVQSELARVDVKSSPGDRL
jgi:hypothetical protein